MKTAMPTEETCAAIAGYLSNLCKQHDPNSDSSYSNLIAPNASLDEEITLPGPNSIAKKTLERELAALTSRVRYLEARASANTHTSSTPQTEGDSHSSPAADGFPKNPRSESAQSDYLSTSSKDSRSWLSTWLARKDIATGDCRTQASSTAAEQPLSDEQLGRIRDYLNQQADQIRDQREQIESLSMQVCRQRKDTDIAFDSGMDDIVGLKRELEKHQQANLAFKKALREIGSIVTNVENGDLSKRVLVHRLEMDPEILRFKKTMNKMMDQLQAFAGQVTHLAKEVGTEGRLGGQAELPGVGGEQSILTGSATVGKMDELIG